jgi:hypothetical protein
MARQTPMIIAANDMYKRQIEMIRDLVRIGHNFQSMATPNDTAQFSYTTFEATKEVRKLIILCFPTNHALAVHQ